VRQEGNELGLGERLDSLVAREKECCAENQNGTRGKMVSTEGKKVEAGTLKKAEIVGTGEGVGRPPHGKKERGLKDP